MVACQNSQDGLDFPSPLCSDQPKGVLLVCPKEIVSGSMVSLQSTLLSEVRGGIFSCEPPLVSVVLVARLDVHLTPGSMKLLACLPGTVQN